MKLVIRLALLLGLLVVQGVGGCPSCPATPPTSPDEIPGPMVTGQPASVSSENLEAVVSTGSFPIGNLESQNLTVTDLSLERAAP